MTPDRIAVSFPGGSYDVLVGEGALAVGLEANQELWRGRSVFVLSSPTVRRLHGERLSRLLSGSRLIELEAPDGEEAKSLRFAEELWRRMLMEGGKRDSLLIALGGGTIGDLGGFVAGSFLRGIDCLQMPTTLLAQVDASVGGKTAIDLPEAKNSVGMFHQPVLVLAEASFLETLPQAELRAGLFEVIKMAFLLDPGLLELVESDLDSLLAGESSKLAPVVARSIRAKVSVVEQDPFEGGVRRLLNFGHTLAQAIEPSLGYQGLRHGEAVGYGMLFAMRLARQRGLPAADERRLGRLVGAIGLPTLPQLDVDELMTLMSRDKKAREQGVVWVLPKALGMGEAVGDVPLAEVREQLAEFLRNPLA